MFLVLLAVSITGCAIHPTKVRMYEGKERSKNEIAMIFNQESFIQEINGEPVGKGFLADSTRAVKMTHLIPGNTKVTVRLITNYSLFLNRERYTKWNFSFNMQTQAGHAYYAYSKILQDGKPIVVVRDLGKLGDSFNPPMEESINTTFPSAKHYQENKSYFEELKTMGTPVKLEYES